MRFSLALLALFFAIPASGKPKKAYEVLPQGKIAAHKMRPCALFHVWATWCTPCIDELPRLLEFLTTHPKIHPVVIDISEPFVQDNFSKKWLEQLAPPFVTYLKPMGDRIKYLTALDPKWPDKLPYTALYDRGKKKAQWLGTLDFDKLDKEMTHLCR